MAKPQPLLITKTQAADLLGISTRTLHDLSVAGEIPSVLIGTRCRRYSQKSLEAFIEKQLTATTDGGRRGSAK